MDETSINALTRMLASRHLEVTRSTLPLPAPAAARSGRIHPFGRAAPRAK